MRYILLLITIFFFGCAPLWERGSRWDTEEKAFNRSATAIVEEEITKGEYKSKLYTKPVVQKVKVPPMIRGGVYIPEHWEYVIIQPGEYVLNDLDAVGQEPSSPRNVRKAEPDKTHKTVTMNVDINDLKRMYGIPDKLLPVFLAEENPDVMIAVYNINVKVVDDIAIVNLEKAKPLVNEQTISSVYIVSDKQIMNIGKHTYIFNCSDNFVSVLYSSEGKSVSIRVSESNAFVTSDGLLIRPICIKGRIG